MGIAMTIMDSRLMLGAMEVQEASTILTGMHGPTQAGLPIAPKLHTGSHSSSLRLVEVLTLSLALFQLHKVGERIASCSRHLPIASLLLLRQSSMSPIRFLGQYRSNLALAS